MTGALDAMTEGLAERGAHAHGIHSAALDHGLAAALKALAADSPIPVDLSVTEERVAPAAEAAIYAASLEGRTSAWNWRTGNTVWTFPHGKYVPVSGSGERLLLHGATELFAVEHKRRR